MIMDECVGVGLRLWVYLCVLVSTWKEEHCEIASAVKIPSQDGVHPAE
jgi:hypothetical protein